MSSKWTYRMGNWTDYNRIINQQKEIDNMKRDRKQEAMTDARLWWEDLTEEDQIWMLMQHGFEKFDPKKITAEQILEIWELENP